MLSSWRLTHLFRCCRIKGSQGEASIIWIDFFSIDQSGLRQRCGIELFTKREVEEVGNGKDDKKQW